MNDSQGRRLAGRSLWPPGRCLWDHVPVAALTELFLLYRDTNRLSTLRPRPSVCLRRAVNSSGLAIASPCRRLTHLLQLGYRLNGEMPVVNLGWDSSLGV